jgi:predicted PurR-regulated permease PerM
MLDVVQAPERIVLFRPRTILQLVGLLLAVGIILWVVWIARHVLTWVLISLFLALALNPLVEWFQRHGVRRRGAAAGLAYVLALAAVGGLAAAFVPPIVDQVNAFSHQVPHYVEQLTHGRGRLGFLETKYHVVEKVRQSIQTGGVKRIFSAGGIAFSVTRSIISAVAATVTIAFMTLFMLLEGPALMDRLYGLLPEHSQPRWRRVGHDIYRTVGGYVNGNLAISVIAGVSSGLLLFLLSVPYSVALGLVVALLDLIPLAGATLAAIVVVLVALGTQGLTAAIIVAVFFIVYQQIENHLLQPLVYGRTVQLSPLVVLVAVLIGAEVAGVLGALGAIPVAGAIQVVIVDWQRARRARIVEPAAAPDAG